ncbi:unnamed protein product, partial [Penicillium salamii]
HFLRHTDPRDCPEVVLLKALEVSDKLPIASLETEDVEEILGLTGAGHDDGEFDSVSPISLPQDLGLYTQLWLEKSDHALFTRGPIQALIHCKLNLLLIAAHEIASVSSSQSTKPLNIQMERTWAYGHVQWKSRIWRLSGRPDYGIWRGEQIHLDLNVVILEAKNFGCVQRHRKNLGMADTTVYGITTDTRYFYFVKLNEKSQWSCNTYKVIRNSFERILGLLVHLMKKAAASMPPDAYEVRYHLGNLTFDSSDSDSDGEADAELDLQ